MPNIPKRPTSIQDDSPLPDVLPDIPDQPSNVIPMPSDWRKGLMTEGNFGYVCPTSFNATYALSHAPEWAGVLGYNLNSAEVTILKPIPVPSKLPDHQRLPSSTYPMTWQEHHSILTSNWLQSVSIRVGKDISADAANVVSRHRPYHPIRDYLTSLTWDGCPRIDHWLDVYLGVESSPYASSVGSRFLISAVARVMSPGCKVDTCLILEGKQGKLKSTALSILANNPRWFTDELPDIKTKDAAIQLRGMWIVELGELDALQDVGMSRIKLFLSRSTDRYRPVHGKQAIDYPRQTAFTASCNHFQYMRDETGARRFWPVEVTHIDLDSLRIDRDQIWAEAVERYLAGHAWWLDTPDLVSLAREEQRMRFEPDVWEPTIESWCRGRYQVTVQQILQLVLGFKMADWGRSEEMRVSKVLHALGRRKIRSEDSSGNRFYCYVTPPAQE